MSQVLRITLARRKAEAFLRENGIETLPVDPFAIAASRDIIVEPKPDAADGVSGMLLRHGDAFGILYATHVPSEGFRVSASPMNLDIIFSMDTSITFFRRAVSSTHLMPASCPETNTSRRRTTSRLDC